MTPQEHEDQLFRQLEGNIQSLQARIYTLELALRKISHWSIPRNRSRLGSNGERDYIKRLAHQALFADLAEPDHDATAP